MAVILKKGAIYKNAKATFEILELGEKVKTKVTKHGETTSNIMHLAPEQFKKMTKFHG